MRRSCNRWRQRQENQRFSAPSIELAVPAKNPRSSGMSSQQTVRPRAIFLDIDGTYADHGVVPDAHAEAVRTARRQGHLVFVCTGRPLSMVPDHILDAGFDGTITGAGARVEIDGEVLKDTRFEPHLASRIVDVLDANN